MRTPIPFGRARPPAGSVPIAFPAIFVPVVPRPATSIPIAALPETTFLAPAEVPPTVLPDPLSTRTPTVLPSPPAPDASVPTRLPATMLPSPERRIPTSNLVSSRPSTWLPSTVTFRPVIFFPVWLSSLTSGDPANPGWLLPSITTGSVTAGNAALVTPIVSTPPPAIANRILSVPANAFASVIACRSDPGPASAVVDTTNVAADACGTSGVADTDTPAAASRLAPAALHRPAPRFT